MDPKQHLAELRAFQTQCQADMRALADGLKDRSEPAFDEAEDARWRQLDEWEAEAKRLADELDQRLTRLDTLAAIPAAREDAPTAPEFNVNTRTDVFDFSDLPTDPRKAAADLNARAFTHVEKSRQFHGDDHKESATSVLEQTHGRAARQILLSEHPDYVSGFSKVSMGREGDLTTEERGRIQEMDQYLRGSGYFDGSGHTAERAAIVANVTGKLVPAHLDPSVVLTNAGASNPFRQLARVVPVTTNVWTGVSSAGITIGWSGVDDQVEVGDDTPTFANPTITCAMWDAFVPITFAAYEDWFGGESEILMMVADAKDRLEAQSFATGSGSNEPFGIVTALDANVSQELAHATNNSFTITDLFALKNALGRRYRPNASFVAEEQWFDRIRQFGTSEGSLYTVSLDVERPDRILGKPAYDASGMSGTMSSAATNNAIVYGDFSNYVITDRVGTIVEFVQNLFATGANRPSAQRGWLVHGRTGADSINDAGFILSQNPKVL